MSQEIAAERQNDHLNPLIIISIVFTFLGTLTVFVRLFTRGVYTKSFGRDDYVIFTAWVASVGFTISSSIGISHGIGQFNEQTTPKQVSTAIKVAFYLEIFYYFAVFLVKVSILLFYLRLVDGIRGKFYICTWSCLAVICFHFISTLVVVFLQCRPLSFYWDQNQPGTCIDITKFFYSTNGFTIASDLIILILPIPTLLKIRRSRAQTISLIGVFGAGALSSVASCVRLYTIKIYTTSTDPLYDAAPITLWSFIEINLGIICASGPALKTFYSLVKDSLLRRNQFKLSSSHSRPRLGEQVELPHQLQRFHEQSSERIVQISY